VTAAYVIHQDGSSPLDGRSLVELRSSVDAVLYDDGRVEEGIPGSHGRGILTLPGQLSRITGTARSPELPIVRLANGSGILEFRLPQLAARVSVVTHSR